MRETLGQTLRRLRLARGLTIQQVADKIGYCKSAVSYWENDRRTPLDDSLTVLGLYYGIDLQGPMLLTQDIKDAQKVLRSWAHDTRRMLRGLSVLGISPEALAGMV